MEATLTRIAQLERSIADADARYTANLTKRGVPKNRHIAEACSLTIRCDRHELARLRGTVA